MVLPLKLYEGPGLEARAPLDTEVTPERTTASLFPTRSFPPCAAVPPSRQYSDAPSSMTDSAYCEPATSVTVVETVWLFAVFPSPSTATIR